MTLTFYNDPKLKAKIVEQVKLHEKLDQIIKGKYWEDGKGCAVGCIVEQCNSPHKKMQEIIGSPLWFNHLVDVIFEGLPNSEAKHFPTRLINAIPVGKDLAKIKHEFLAWLLEDVKQHIKPKYKDVLKAINHIIDLHVEASRGKIVSESVAWSAARSAAESAALSAWSTAESAAESAALSAWSAARSAWSAESVAWSAARSAWSAESAEESAALSARSVAWSTARSAARSTTYLKMADKLIELLKEIEK